MHDDNKSPPQRIASLLASATEILYGMGLGERVVAVSHECDFPPDVRDKPRVSKTLVDDQARSGAIDAQVQEMAAAGSAMYAIDEEALARLAPELIVTQSHCDVCAVRYDDVVTFVQETAALVNTRIVDLNPMTLEAVLADVLRVGAAAGAEVAAREFVAELRRRIDTVKAATAGVENRPRVICIEWIEPVMVAANWMPELVDLAGGQCEMTSAGDASGYTRWEDVAAYDPERIVIMPCGFDLARTLAEWDVLKRHDGWHQLAAVRSGRVYATDGNAYFNRSGPRLVDSLELLAHLVHPERCPPPRNGAGRFQKVN